MAAAQQMLVSYSAGALVASYATWNPADKDAGAVLSGGNLIVTYSSANTTSQGVRSTIGKSSGKWYWEMGITSGGATSAVGIATLASTFISGSTVLGTDTASVGYQNNGLVTNRSTLISSSSAFYINGTRVGIALDMGAGTLDFYVANVFQIRATGLSGTFYAALSGGNGNNQVWSTNFGATALTYTPPTGFNAGLYN